MGSMFGKKSPNKSPNKPSITEQDRAILVKIDLFFF